MLKNKGKSLLVLISCLFIFAVPMKVSSNNTVNVLLNGKEVAFTDSSGYPYLDENNRTMVPLRVTMESAGFVVGYDEDSRTAIVITEHNRIEVPIGTNKVYTNNKLIENDTIAVVQDGRTYLPIRAVLENAGYTVEWAGDTNTVNAYTFNYDANELVPYSTSSRSTLIKALLKGNVVYIQGQYYATPDYVKLLTNVQVHYSGSDLNTAVYPEANRYDLSEFDKSQSEWVSGLRFDYILVQDSQLEMLGGVGKPSEIPGYSYSYVFYEQVDKIIYCVDEMTDEFFNATNTTGIFNGIRMKKENNILFFNYADLKDKNIYK